jgi:hypothetical protein
MVWFVQAVDEVEEGFELGRTTKEGRWRERGGVHGSRISG